MELTDFSVEHTETNVEQTIGVLLTPKVDYGAAEYHEVGRAKVFSRQNRA